MNVLSLFDGMSCGQIALERAGVKVDSYFASEIDKYAIQVTKHNYPSTKHIGDVTKVKVKTLYLSEVMCYINSYEDNNIQSKFREWEMLYWLNKDFTLSAKVRTQKPNERQEVSESPDVQRIEEIWFSNCELGSVRMCEYIRGSGVNRKRNDIEAPRQLQCSDWGYDNDFYRRYKKENIRVSDREAKDGNSQKKNFRNIEKEVFEGGESESCFRENQKSYVEERCSRELFEGTGEDRFSKKVNEEKRNGRKEENNSIDEVIRELCSWDETNGITQDYWNILRLHKKEQVTVVEHENGFNIFRGQIDLLCGGSPCQGFSFAGKQLNFDNPRSKLFFEFVRLLKETKPKYFLLENVLMKKEYEQIITGHLGVEPICINSSLVSAQNRVRLYWTNIPYNQLWDESTLTVEDILEDNVDAKYWIDPKRQVVILENEVKRRKIAYIGSDSQGNRIYRIHDKSVCLCGDAGGLGAKTGLYALPCLTPDRTETRQSGRRFKPPMSKFYTLTAKDKHGVLVNNSIRKLTPVECERLQTVPDNYTDGVLDNQRYKMLGNGWTVDVIAHIFKGLLNENL